MKIRLASPETGSSLRREVAGYIERCHLADGGYFFARVLPSSALDTFFAVKSLSLLRMKPEHPRDIAEFFFGMMNAGWLNKMAGLYASSSSGS